MSNQTTSPRPSVRRQDALRALQDLLLSLFHGDLDGLKYLLMDIPGYERAGVHIPDAQGQSPFNHIWAVIQWLESSGLIRAAFIEAIIGRYPGREADIREVQRMLQRVVLLATASPEGLDRLDGEREARELESSLHTLLGDPGWAVIVKHGIKVDTLVPVMRRYRPDILHFSGHGSEWGRLVVEQEGGARQVPSGPLLRLVVAHTPPLQCAVWSACHSSRLAEATVNAGAPCAIGVSDRIRDRTAIELAAGFYVGLSSGQAYDQALETGRLHANIQGQRGAELVKYFGAPGLIPKSLH